MALQEADTNSVGNGQPTRGELQVELFGGPRLFHGGKAVKLSPLQGALVALLFGGAPRSVTRDGILRMMWGDSIEPKMGNHRLAQLLYSLHRRLKGSRLCDVPQGSAAVIPSPVDSDLALWQKHLEAGLLDPAVDVFDRGFLSELTPQTELLRDWVEARRVALASELRRAATRGWKAAEESGRIESARTAAEVLLRLHPNDEQALRKVIWARAMAGEVHEARVAYEEFTTRQGRLSTEDWRADAETLDLLGRLDSLKATSTAGFHVHKTTASHDPPFIGRVEELRALRETFSTIPESHLPLVVVSGEAGIGKTRLIEESLPAARLAGATVLWAKGTELGRSIPLSPLIEALRDGDVGQVADELEAPWRNVLLGLMPEFHQGSGPLPPIPSVQAGSVPHRLFEAVRRLLARICESGPLVIAFDDFQWADDTTISAVSFLLRRWREGQLTIALGMRKEGISPPSSVLTLLSEGLERLDSRELELVELTDEEAELLARSVAPPDVGDTEIRELCEVTGRVPYFLIETIQDAQVDRPDSQSRGERDTRFTKPPSSILRLLSGRLDQLPETAEQVLSVLAISRGPLTVVELSRITRARPDPVARAGELLEQLRLIQSSGTSLRVRHDTVARAVIGRLSSVRVCHYSGRIARHLVRQGEAEHLDEIAIHFDRARDQDSALRYSLLAAERSEAAGAIAEAIKALAVARRNASDDRATLEILGSLSRLTYLSQDFRAAAPLLAFFARRLREAGRAAEATLAEARHFDATSRTNEGATQECLLGLRDLRDEAELAGSTYVVSTIDNITVRLYHRLAMHSKVGSTLNRATVDSPTQAVEARIQNLLLQTVGIYYGDIEKAADAAATALALAIDQRDRNLEAEAVNRSLMVHAGMGTLHLPGGLEVQERALEIANRTGDLFLRYSMLANIGVYELDRGDFAKARDLLSRAQEAIEGSAASAPRILNALNLGEITFSEGDFDGAIENFRRALSIEATHGSHPLFRRIANAGLGLCQLELGDLRDARQAATRLGAPSTPWHYDAYLETLLYTRVLRRGGHHSEADEILLSHCAHLDDRFPLLWIKVATERAVWLSRRGEKHPASQLARGIREECHRRNAPRRLRQLGSLGKTERD